MERLPNYDRYIEKSFELIHGKESFHKIVSPEDLKNHVNKVQIVKFHGDFDSDESIVLSESDFFRRLDFEDPLDIKFRSDSLAKSILFVGYSLTDINMRYIMYKLSKIWAHTKQPPKSFLFTTATNIIQEKVLDQWNVKVITNDISDKKASLIDFLESIS